MTRYVLDAFALLAYFRNEPGAPTVSALLDEAEKRGERLPISAVNLAEVVYKSIRGSGIDGGLHALARVRQLPVEVIALGEELALEAAVIKGAHRISYADCVAAALAQKLDAKLVTGDTGLRDVPDLAIEWLAPPKRPRRR